MIRWNPDSELAQLHSAMDRLFDDFFGESRLLSNGSPRSAPAYQLPLDVREVDRAYEIQAPVPGFKPEEVEITFADGVLRIQAQHTAKTEDQKNGYLRREVARGTFQRALQLPNDIRGDEITADFSDGILTVTVPRVTRPEPRKIAVGVGKQKQLAGKGA